MIDLQQLRYFVAVAETESIARAAERLHISQSPLSRQILALESRLGLTLFARARQRLRLTPAGRIFVDEARELLQRAARLEQRAQEIALGASRTLVVGFVESAVYCGLLQAALRALRRAAPGARAELRNLRSADQLSALQSGDIDIGFSHAPAPRGSGLSSTRLVDEPFLLALPPRHHLASRPVKAADLASEAFIAVPATVSPTGHEAFLAACQRAGFSPRIGVEAADPSTVLGLVHAGVGVAMLQASLARVAPAGVSFVRPPAGFRMKLQIYRLCPPTPHPLLEHLVSR